MWDMADGIEYSYAYAKADNQEDAIKKVNESDIPDRKYTERGLDQIDEVITIPLEDINKVIK